MDDRDRVDDVVGCLLSTLVFCIGHLFFCNLVECPVM